MGRLLPLVAFLLLAVAIALLCTTNTRTTGERARFPSGSGEGGSGPLIPASSGPRTPIPSDDPRLARYSDGTVDYLDSLETSRALHRGPDPAVDLALLDELFASYRLFFKANPVGSENAELTAQLLGHNRLNLRFLEADSVPLDARGALVDRWGSPYFFHPLSAEVMGIRSAGPDQKLWTADDLESDTGGIETALQLRTTD